MLGTEHMKNDENQQTITGFENLTRISLQYHFSVYSHVIVRKHTAQMMREPRTT
jgi:hypothetical protein